MFIFQLEGDLRGNNEVLVSVWELGEKLDGAVAEQVIVPNGTVTLHAGETRTTTTFVVPFAEPGQLAGGNASFRMALWGRPEVLCGKNTMIWTGLQIGRHNDCPNAGLDKLRAHMKENFGFIFPTICSLNDIRKVLAYNRRWQGARAGQISNVDLVLLSRPTGMDPSRTSFFQLLGIGTKMVGPGASEIVLDLASVALVAERRSSLLSAPMRSR